MMIHNCPYMERIGATESREAMMMPISQMLAVRRSAQVGSPLALPCPKTCNNTSAKEIKELNIYQIIIAVSAAEGTRISTGL